MGASAGMEPGFWNDRCVLVTGASGFLGAHLTRRLLTEGAEVAILVRDEFGPRLATLLSEGPLQPAVIQGDLSDGARLRKEMKEFGPQIVFHLAAAGVNPAADPTAIVQTNVVGTVNVLQACRELGLERFVYAGSCAEYGSGRELSEEVVPAPTSMYGASKSAGALMVRTYAQLYGLPFVHLRPFMLYGPFERRGRLVPNAILTTLAGQPIRMTAGEQERDFVYIDDAVQGFLAAAASSNKECLGQPINLSSGEGHRIRDVVMQVLGIMGSQTEPLFGALPYREGEMWYQSGSNLRASEWLGWTPRTSLSEGLARTVKWVCENSPLASTLEN